jgi:hypothetical protein
MIKSKYLKVDRSVSFDEVSELLLDQSTDDEECIGNNCRVRDQNYRSYERCQSVDMLDNNYQAKTISNDMDMVQDRHRKGLRHFIEEKECFEAISKDEEYQHLLSQNLSDGGYHSIDPTFEYLKGGENSPAWSSVVNPLKQVPKTSVKASIFSLVASMVGGGTLSIPFAFQEAG